MDSTLPIRPITASDDAIAAAVADAVVPPLLPAVAHATGDFSLLDPGTRPDIVRVREEQGGLTPDQQTTARSLAAAALAAHRDRGSPPPPPLDREQVRQLMEYTIGGSITDDYLPLLREELGLDGDLRAPDWTLPDLDPGRDFSVVIIGAGMSGILAGYRLGQVGVPYTVLEKNSGVGGTWLENSYPGCRVDVSNHLYSYSFVRHDWSQHFSSRDVLRDYFDQCATDFGVRPHIQFETEVSAVTFDDDRGSWAVEIRRSDGREAVLRADAVISAVGQLNRPKYPDIDGWDSFEGPSFHSARWDDTVVLGAKRVGVIGTGCSAAQFIPIVADEADSLTVFQRTANWLVPTPDYHEPVSDGFEWCLHHIPFYAEWHRLWLFWRSAEGMLDAARVDPDWDQGERSVSARNDEFRALLTLYLEHSFADAPELLPHVIPDYPPGAKRVIRDNGIWPATLQRSDVELVTDGIARITPTGVELTTGEHRDLDVLIFATGFQASQFLTPMKVTGRSGVDLHRRWDGNARAYAGVTIPEFPNFFCLYGPNTNIVVNGSIIWFSECQVHYVLQCLRTLFEEGATTIDVTEDAHDRYNRWIDEGNLAMAWGVSSVNSWYKSDSGRVAQNWPFTMLEYWLQTRAVDRNDYHLA